MLSSIIKTALMLAGVAQADFVMMKYLAARDSTRGELDHDSFYFANLTDAQVAAETQPSICEIGQLYPKVDGVAGYTTEGALYQRGVVVDEGEDGEGFGMPKPKRVEVYWGKDEGHWTLYGVTHGGNKPYDIIELNDFKKGHCDMQYREPNRAACVDHDGTIATVWPFARCTSSYFHPPIERFAAREPVAVANSASR